MKQEFVPQVTVYNENDQGQKITNFEDVKDY